MRAPGQTDRPHILIADREARMRRALRRLIGETEFSWLEAESVRQLLSIAPDPDVRLVILDERLPGLDLNATGRALRTAGCRAPLVLVTNGTDPTDALPADWAAPGLVRIDRLRVGAQLRDQVEVLLAAVPQRADRRAI